MSQNRPAYTLYINDHEDGDLNSTAFDPLILSILLSVDNDKSASLQEKIMVYLNELDPTTRQAILNALTSEEPPAEDDLKIATHINTHLKPK